MVIPAHAEIQIDNLKLQQPSDLRNTVGQKSCPDKSQGIIIVFFPEFFENRFKPMVSGGRIGDKGCLDFGNFIIRKTNNIMDHKLP
jgi:hypothetical protein